MTDPDPAAIARKLTPRMAEALFLACGAGPIYQGDRWDFAPAQFRKLESLGLVRRWAPLNLSHRERAVATPLGIRVRAVLEQDARDA
jgi:hypothetical protein